MLDNTYSNRVSMRQRYCLYGPLVTIIVRYNDHWLPASLISISKWLTNIRTNRNGSNTNTNKQAHAHVHVFVRFCFIDIRWVCRSFSFTHHFSLFICNRTHTHLPHTRTTWISILLFSLSWMRVCVLPALCMCFTITKF